MLQGLKVLDEKVSQVKDSIREIGQIHIRLGVNLFFRDFKAHSTEKVSDFFDSSKNKMSLGLSETIKALKELEKTHDDILDQKDKSHPKQMGEGHEIIGKLPRTLQDEFLPSAINKQKVVEFFSTAGRNKGCNKNF
jgi:hypothetical protein